MLGAAEAAWDDKHEPRLSRLPGLARGALRRSQCGAYTRVCTPKLRDESIEYQQAAGASSLRGASRTQVRSGAPALNQYSPQPGLLELRKAVADFVHQRYGGKYEPNGEVVATAGGQVARGVCSAFVRILSPVLCPCELFAFHWIVRTKQPKQGACDVLKLRWGRRHCRRHAFAQSTSPVPAAY